MRLEDVLRRLRNRAAERKSEIATALAAGCCADHAAYKGHVGEYRGLSRLEDMVKEVLNEIEQDEDE